MTVSTVCDSVNSEYTRAWNHEGLDLPHRSRLARYEASGNIYRR